MTTQYVQIDGTGRLLAASEDAESIPGGIAHEFPADFDWAQMPDYRIVGGELVHDPQSTPPASPVVELRTGQDDTVDALAEVGVLVDTNALTIEDALNAIAELGAIVAGEGVV